MTPQKTPKQKGVSMGFPGTFACLKSRLSYMAGNQVRYGPNGPGNQAPGRSASILTRMASRGRYSIKFRSTCSGGYFSYQCVYRLWSNIWGRKCKVLPSITCQNWSQIHHTTSRRCLYRAYKSSRMCTGWATDPRISGNHNEGWMGVECLGTDNSWPWAPMKKLFSLSYPEEACL